MAANQLVQARIDGAIKEEATACWQRWGLPCPM
jgi:antitoxin component of RelBE/YafQ-DinJ toxin-antitoxin module